MYRIRYNRDDGFFGDFGSFFRGTFDDGTKEGRQVTVKKITLYDLREEQEGKRRNEILMKLDHPNVVKLFHSEDQELYRCYALELCEASLDQVFLGENDPKKYKGSMPSDIDALLQLSSGLAYIQSKNIIHLDIKPKNALIFFTGKDRSVQLKWANFFLLSPRVENLKKYFKTGNIIVSPFLYCAPELLKLLYEKTVTKNGCLYTETVDGKLVKVCEKPSSDVFKAGLLFFTILTNGLHLFGSSFIIRENIIRDNQINSEEIPKNHFAKEIIDNMVKHNPDDRWDMEKVIAALEPLVKEDRAKQFSHLCPKLIDEQEDKLFVQPIKYGEELLEKIVQIANDLYFDVNHVDDESLYTLTCYVLQH